MSKHRTHNIVVLIPAHNEERGIAQTIQSVWAQSVRPSKIVVVSDNSTDSTVTIAKSCGADVIETVSNVYKKAGALNQGLGLILPDLEDQDYIFAIDADTSLDPDFLSVSTEILDKDANVGAVGAVFVGRTPTNVIELAQTNEYVRYSRQIERSGRTMVLSGTAAVIRVSAFRQLKDYRGTYYDNHALTEDMEIGLALKTLGWKLRSPVACKSTTDLMTTFNDLHKQRVRWYRGAFENLKSYGITKVTARYWFQQLVLAFSILMMGFYIFLTSVVAVTGTLTFSPFWFMVGAIFWAERLVTAWKNGWRGRLLASLVLPELVYDIFLQTAFVKALYLSLRNKTAEWHHA